MAGEDAKKKQKRKKRSGVVIEEVQEEPSKIPRLRENEGIKTQFEEVSPWKNLQLILSLQDKSKDLAEKIEFAFEFVKSSSTTQTDHIGRPSQVLSTSRTLIVMNNWVQSVLVSSEKEMRTEEKRPVFETPGSCLDIRCWKILHFSLNESKKLNLSLVCFRDFLRVIRSIATDVSSYFLKNVSGRKLSDQQLELYDVVLDCVSLVFSFHGGVANENLELWLILIDEVLKLILKVYTAQLCNSQLGKFVLQLTCYLLEPFAKFLKVHPTRKNGFRDFIDKLLEPLLHLLYLLLSSSSNCNIELSTNLSKLVEEVLAQGLFHSTHIDGFLGLNNSVKYKNSSDATLKVEKSVNKSYHKHLFDKLEKIVSEKKGLASAGLGEMLHLFVSCVTKHKGANLNAELRKFILDYFVQLMEYVLSDVNKYLQSDVKIEHILLNAPSSLKSMSNLLASLVHENVYLRTEDTSEGGFKNFLILIYDTVMSFSNSITHLQTSVFGSDERAHRDLLISVRKELIVTVHNLLDIEYEVVGDDLENIWSMVFSSLACSCSSVDETLLFPNILSLGRKLMDLYSELRQVNSSMFALCKAVKHSTVTLGDSESSTQSHFYSSYSNSVSKLLCSSELRLSLSNAIKSVPEGQSPGFIRQLTLDITESLEWINFERHTSNFSEITHSDPHNSDFLRFSLRAQVLGRVLCDVYAIVLDSISVSSGNSSPFGASLRNLIDTIYPNASKLISLLPDRVKKSSDNVSTCWILVFLFRLLISCRSLLQQVISLMPPDLLKKKSGLIGDSFIARSWKDWSEMSGCGQDGCFNLSIINSVSHIYIHDSVLICPPLCYVLHAMAFQRLVDLNRLIKSSEYMLQWNQSLSQTNLKEDSDLSSYRKRAKKWKKCVLEMKEEAAGLTKFILGYISTVNKDQRVQSSFGGAIDDKKFRFLRNYDTPDFAVGSLDQKSLALTLWWIVCENVDLWCSHAVKKDLKNFLTLLIQAFLSCESDFHIGICNVDKASVPKKVAAHRIALKFLSNTISHEQRSIRRYMASRFCKILENSLLPVFTASGVDLSKSPDWEEVMSTVENLSDVEVGSLTCTRPNMVPAKVEFATCQHLLAFLMRMPGEYLISKSSSLYITYILNLERFLVDSMYNASNSHSPYEIFRLFVSCRRAFKFLTAASCTKTVDSCQSLESPFLLMWLLKSLSAVTGFQRSLPQDNTSEAKNTVFSLVDHTSNAFQIISRDQFECAIESSKKFQKKRKSLDPSNEVLDLSEHGLQIEKNSDEGVLQVVGALVENMQDCLDKHVESLAGCHELTKSTSVIACFQGLLTGLVSAFCDKNVVDGSNNLKLSSYHVKLMTRIDPCVTTSINFLPFLLKAFFLEDGGYDVSHDALHEGEIHPTEKILPSTRKGGLRKCYFKRNSNPEIPDIGAFMSKVQNVRQCLKKSLLIEVMRGKNHEAALFLQQLFLSCSAILRLDLLTDTKSICWSLFPIVVGISQFLLLEFSTSTEMPHIFAFYCLNAIVTFLEVLSSYFPQTDPTLSRDFDVNLVDLHIMAIGKCISFQGKAAKLASQETESHSSQLGEFKRGLRTSFKTYVKESSELRLLSAIQTVEKALVGVKEGLITNYEILIGGSYGGEVSSVVAAGVDCLDLILEFVTGHKHSNILKSHVKSLVACVFNIILHLQASSIFLGFVDSIKGYSNPDPGSVIHMCIGTLSTISGKPSFFHIESCHIAQSLRVPGALFHYFLQLQLSQSPNTSADVDWTFSMELYDGCCRLLCTSLKHHNNESLQCIALLQDSVNILLHCLEIVNIDPVVGRESSSAWEVQEAVKCASSLRRVYEEVRQQKDTFGQSSYLFLSSYIWCYCGLGPAKRGIIREVDEALRPGIYALLDSCSNDDFQLLHTTFGEGPCRSTLAALQHDYKVNYQYEGKV